MTRLLITSGGESLGIFIIQFRNPNAARISGEKNSISKCEICGSPVKFSRELSPIPFIISFENILACFIQNRDRVQIKRARRERRGGKISNPQNSYRCNQSLNNYIICGSYDRHQTINFPNIRVGDLQRKRNAAFFFRLSSFSPTTQTLMHHTFAYT